MATGDVGPAAYRRTYSPSQLAWSQVWRSAATWLCPAFVRWTKWTLAVTLLRWQHCKIIMVLNNNNNNIIIIIIIIIINTVRLTCWAGEDVAGCLSGNALVLINIVALHLARLALGWVTFCGYTILVFNQSHPGLLSLAIPPWVGTMSTGNGLGHR